MSTESVTIQQVREAVATQPADAESYAQYAERIALRLAIPVAILIGALVVVANWQRSPVPLLQDRQGFGVILLFITPVAAMVTCAIAYALGVNARNTRTSPDFRRKWAFGVLPIGLAYGAVVAVMIVVLLDLLDTAFRDLELAILQGTAIAALTAGALTQWAVKQALQASSAKLLELAMLIIAGGIYLTAATVDNPEWWRVSFSFLGSLRSNANTIFNVTLVFGGILIITWMPYFLMDMRVLVRHQIAAPQALKWLSIGMWWLAIAVALVGIFKTQANPFSSIVHNLAAYSLAAVFGLLMIAMRWLVPNVPRELHMLTWILLAGMAATLALAAIGYVNTVGLEIIAFSLGIMWLQSLARHAAIAAPKLEPGGYPT